MILSIWLWTAAGTVDRANLQLGERVLDLASGTGLCALDAAQRVGPEGAVVGADLTDAMLAVVRRFPLAPVSPALCRRVVGSLFRYRSLPLCLQPCCC